RQRRGPSTPLDALDAAELGAVLGRAAAAVMRLWPALDRELVQNGLSELLATLELPLSELLAELELRGVLVDISLLDRLGTGIDARLLELEQEAQALVGRPFNVHSP